MFTMQTNNIVSIFAINYVCLFVAHGMWNLKNDLIGRCYFGGDAIKASSLCTASWLICLGPSFIMAVCIVHNKNGNIKASS